LSFDRNHTSWPFRVQSILEAVPFLSLQTKRKQYIYIYKILKSWNWLILAALQRKIKIKILLAKERSLPMSYRGFGPSTRSNLASVGPSSAFGLGSSKYQLQTSSPYDLK
jgi:hypothetical protein